MLKKSIPVFYACDDSFVKYTIVSIKSMMMNASKEYILDVHILNSSISDEMKGRLKEMENDNLKIFFDDVTPYLDKMSDKLPIRDYYSKTTYYRFFISVMYPHLDKAIYIDSDTIVQGDLSRLYDTDIGDCYCGACHEQAMVQVDEYGTYVERVIGISRHNFFNAGIMLINCKKFRSAQVLDQFIEYLNLYNFVVTQDEDYLNLICKDHVFWLDQRWNTEVFGTIAYPIEEAKIIHYIMTSKPWHYSDCRHGDIFWNYAKETSVYSEIKDILESYTDEEKERDRISCDKLLALAISETQREDNFLNIYNSTMRATDRVAVCERIREYERLGIFDKDVEEDPPSKELKPEDINYLKRGFTGRIKRKIAYSAARRFVKGLIKNKKMIIKEIRGLENINSLTSGAVMTCNHFNPYDSFAMQIAYEASNQKKRTFYRVIREGNYTSFPGFFGFLMRNCNTLPLSSNRRTLKKFLDATDTLLRNGNLVLVYPEQSMWWNYRKPKPLKIGAFQFASRSNVPVLPCFITMKDSGIMGDDGYFIQEYTIHIEKPIFPDESLEYRQRAEKMKEENYNIWKEIYEREYDIPLYYETENNN